MESRRIFPTRRKLAELQKVESEKPMSIISERNANKEIETTFTLLVTRWLCRAASFGREERSLTIIHKEHCPLSYSNVLQESFCEYASKLTVRASH